MSYISNNKKKSFPELSFSKNNEAYLCILSVFWQLYQGLNSFLFRSTYEQMMVLFVT